MFDHYSVNVSLNGQHFFATAPHSCRDKVDLDHVLPVLKDRFTEADGFKITVTRWTFRGEAQVDLVP